VQLDNLDADSNGVINTQDVDFLLKVKFRLLRFVKEIVVEPVSAKNQCYLQISAHLVMNDPDAGDVAAPASQTKVFFDLESKKSSFSNQLKRSLLLLGDTTDISKGAGYSGTIWAAAPLAGGQFAVRTFTLMEGAKVGLSLIQATLDASGAGSAARTSPLMYGYPKAPFTYSDPMLFDLSLGDSRNTVLTFDLKSGYNPFTVFENSLSSPACQAGATVATTTIDTTTTTSGVVTTIDGLTTISKATFTTVGAVTTTTSPPVVITTTTETTTTAVATTTTAATPTTTATTVVFAPEVETWLESVLTLEGLTVDTLNLDEFRKWAASILSDSTGAEVAPTSVEIMQLTDVVSGRRRQDIVEVRYRVHVSATAAMILLLQNAMSTQEFLDNLGEALAAAVQVRRPAQKVTGAEEVPENPRLLSSANTVDDTTSTGPPIAVIAGAAGGAALLIIIVVAVVLTRRRGSTVRPAPKDNAALLGEDAVEMHIVDRHQFGGPLSRTASGSENVVLDDPNSADSRMRKMGALGKRSENLYSSFRKDASKTAAKASLALPSSLLLETRDWEQSCTFDVSCKCRRCAEENAQAQAEYESMERAREETDDLLASLSAMLDMDLDTELVADVDVGGLALEVMRLYGQIGPSDDGSGDNGVSGGAAPRATRSSREADVTRRRFQDDDVRGSEQLPPQVASNQMLRDLEREYLQTDTPINGGIGTVSPAKRASDTVGGGIGDRRGDGDNFNGGGGTGSLAVVERPTYSYVAAEGGDPGVDQWRSNARSIVESARGGRHAEPSRSHITPAAASTSLQVVRGRRPPTHQERPPSYSQGSASDGTGGLSIVRGRRPPDPRLARQEAAAAAVVQCSFLGNCQCPNCA